jgi:predicted nucleic acid-binding protein
VSYLVDTNVILRLILPADSQHALVNTAVNKVRIQGDILYITSQILIEFQAVATRPILANGLGLTSAQASLEAKKLEAIFPLLPETPAIYPQWRTLVDQYTVSGKQVHDTRLVAVMLVHGLTHLLTLNGTDFQRFSTITVVEP